MESLVCHEREVLEGDSGDILSEGNLKRGGMGVDAPLELRKHFSCLIKIEMMIPHTLRGMSLFVSSDSLLHCRRSELPDCAKLWILHITWHSVLTHKKLSNVSHFFFTTCIFHVAESYIFSNFFILVLLKMYFHMLLHLFFTFPTSKTAIFLITSVQESFLSLHPSLLPLPFPSPFSFPSFSLTLSLCFVFKLGNTFSKV